MSSPGMCECYWFLMIDTEFPFVGEQATNSKMACNESLLEGELFTACFQSLHG